MMIRVIISFVVVVVMIHIRYSNIKKKKLP